MYFAEVFSELPLQSVLRGTPAAHVAESIVRAIHHPWLLAGGASSKRERRAARIRVPRALPALAGRYRFDGGFSLSPAGIPTGAWGAAFWAPGNSDSDPQTVSASELCPDPSTNNIAEFFGFRECLRRAIRNPLPLIVFEGDSMLVASLMAGRWGCHRAHIRELLNECYDLGEHLSSLNCTWFVRHIYREINEVANDLASECIRTGRGRASPGW